MLKILFYTQQGLLSIKTEQTGKLIRFSTPDGKSTRDRTKFIFYHKKISFWGFPFLQAQTSISKIQYSEGVNMGNILKVGNKAFVSKAFSEEEVFQFANISTDRNPLHLDKDFGEATVFGQRIVHGMLVASLFSGLIGTELPGVGSIYLGQNLTFKAPVAIDEQVTASVEIIHVREDKPIVTLRTLCINSEGTVVIEGEAVVKAMEPTGLDK
jgi:acyl dehydratase